MSIVKHCNSELSKKNEENKEYLIEIMHMAMLELSKINQFCFENMQDYYNLWYSLLIRMNDMGKLKQTLRISEKMIFDLEKLSYFSLLVNFYILSSNCILKNPDLTIEALEQVYDFLAIKCKNLLTTQKQAFDKQILNKVYQNAFKILMKTGKILDNLAGGNQSLHEQALFIRNVSLSYLKKTKPLILSDYFAFAYSSVLGAYKVGSSCECKILLQGCIDSIDASLEIKDLNYAQDKNLRNMIELKSFLLLKVENYSKIKPTLSLLLLYSNSLPSVFSNIKTFLDISKASFLGKLDYSIDVENTISSLASFFDDKLTSPSVLSSSELSELKELSPKVLNSFDN